MQEDQAREGHPDRQDGFVGMRKGMMIWEIWCRKTKRNKNSQEKDPRICEGNSQGKDPRTLDPRTLEAPDTRWRVQKKRKVKKWKRKKRKKRKKVKHRRSLWWTKRKEQVASFLVSERKEEAVMEKRER